jgi:hypothetical protein
MIMTATSLPIPSSGDDTVRAVAAKVEKAMEKVPAGLKDGMGAGGVPELIEVGWAMMSMTGGARTRDYSTALVDGRDWRPLGRVASRGKPVRGWRAGYMLAMMIDGRRYEAYGDESRPGVTTLLRNGTVIGWWSVESYSYEGRFAEPLMRALYLADGRLLGKLDTANLSGGCAALELEPDGQLVVPLRTKAPGIIQGNPLKEVWKMTPFGRNSGPRAENIDRVLTRQARLLEVAEELELVFVSSLWLRGMECVKVSTAD